MRLGAYNAVLHDRSLPEALKVLGELGLTGAEINSGGFLPPVHIPMDDLLASAGAREDYLGQFEQAGIALTGLNCNGNPLNPLPDIGPAHAADLHRSIEVAGLLGVTRVVTMSGVPGSDPGAAYPSWVVNTWDSQYTDVQDYQWDVAVPFWRDIDARARDAGVKVCIEMHPQNIVFNPPTLRRLVERTGATHVGAEMDPSHLFWQGIDPVAAVEWLGPLVFHAAAKDTLIHDGQLQGLRRAGRPAHPGAGRSQPAQPRRPQLPEQVAGGPGVGVRPRGPRARRRLLGPLPGRAGRGRPGHGGQHRARGPGLRPGRGTPAGRRDADRGEGQGRGVTAHRLRVGLAGLGPGTGCR